MHDALGSRAIRWAICYYSGSGNTKLACKFIAARLSIPVDLVDITVVPGADLAAYDAVGLATFTDFGSIPERFIRYLAGLPDQGGKAGLLPQHLWAYERAHRIRLHRSREQRQVHGRRLPLTSHAGVVSAHDRARPGFRKSAKPCEDALLRALRRFTTLVCVQPRRGRSTASLAPHATASTHDCT